LSIESIQNSQAAFAAERDGYYVTHVISWMRTFSFS